MVFSQMCMVLTEIWKCSRNQMVVNLLAPWKIHMLDKNLSKSQQNGEWRGDRERGERGGGNRDRQTDKNGDRERETQRDRQTENVCPRERDRQTETETDRDIHDTVRRKATRVIYKHLVSVSVLLCLSVWERDRDTLQTDRWERQRQRD